VRVSLGSQRHYRISHVNLLYGWECSGIKGYSHLYEKNLYVSRVYTVTAIFYLHTNSLMEQYKITCKKRDKRKVATGLIGKEAVRSVVLFYALNAIMLCDKLRSLLTHMDKDR